jgi:hypothetical protein
MARAQGAMRPLTLKSAQHALPFRNGQTSPFDLGHQQSLGIFRVRGDQIQFDIALPITSGAGVTRPAKILKHRGGMFMNEFPLLRRRIGRPLASMGRIDAEPEAHRRVLNAIESLLGGAQAFAEWQLARQDGGVQQLLQQSR